jgi:chaperone BCS1
MTTNNPEKLDSALVRPGRVDLQIKFALATREQIRDIFKRMYSTEVDEKKRGNDKETDGKTEGTCQCALSAAKSTMNSMPSVAIPPARLAEMAEQFTNQIPECALSPAEIQGYLLINKTDAAGALAGVREWVVKLLEAKKKGKKVVEVQ